MQPVPACPEVIDHVHQHLAVVSNNTPWYYLFGAILVGAALVAWGAQTTFERWEKDAHLPGWFSVAGGVFGILLATAMGTVAGHLFWHWALGMLCALTGAWGSQWILGLIFSRFGGEKPLAQPQVLVEAKPVKRRRNS